jgi:hypothetical protein
VTASTGDVSKEPRVRQRWLTRLRSGFGVPRYELTEVFDLGEHILHRLERGIGEPPEFPFMNYKQAEDWVAARFTYPLRTLLLQASRNTRGHVLLNLVVIGGGFAISGIAVAAGAVHKGTTTSWIVFSVGLVVALAGGASQVLRPGYRATQRATLAMELREEGWAFVNMAKDYDGGFRDGVDRFDQRISAIHRRAAQIVGLEADSGTGPTRAWGSRT